MIYTELSKNDLVDFPTALKACFKGDLIINLNWNKKYMYVYCMSGLDAPLTGQFLMLHYGDDDNIPWTPNQLDIFSNEWIIKSRSDR